MQIFFLKKGKYCIGFLTCAWLGVIFVALLEGI